MKNQSNKGGVIRLTWIEVGRILSINWGADCMRLFEISYTTFKPYSHIHREINFFMQNKSRGISQQSLYGNPEKKKGSMRMRAVFWIQEEKNKESSDENRSGDDSKHYFSPFLDFS